MLWPSDAKSDSLENILMLERLKAKGEVRRKRVRRLDSITNSMDMNLSKLQETVKNREPVVLQSMGLQRVGYDLGTEQQQRINKLV